MAPKALNTNPEHLADHIEVRIQTEIGQAWELIPPTTIRIFENEDPGDLARRFITPEVTQVRWNWGDLPPGGVGCGHYIPGPAHPYYHLTGDRER